MAFQFKHSNATNKSKNRHTWVTVAFFVTGALLLPGTAFAQFDAASGSVCSFFGNTTGILNMVSIAVVTIAVVFAGYQIAFAHKRIADVAPILIGGVLIGAAGQVATMLIPGGGTSCSSKAAASLVMHLLNNYA
jgi:type IV secretion system protein VirB2